MDQRPFQGKREDLESDWIWICLAALWQRWFPDIPCFELLDDKMQAGYDLLTFRLVVAACRIWLEAWSDVLRILDKAGMQSIEEFDDRFRGSESLFNWIQDLEDELWNAGLDDRQFLSARVAVCEEGLRRFRTDDELLTENRQRALAESYYELGEPDKAEALYRDWLHADPRWGWGWIGWSDCYRFTRTELRDWAGASKSCGRDLPSPMFGTAPILPNGWQICARSRGDLRRPRSSGGKRNEALRRWRPRGVSARPVLFCGKD